MPDRKESHVPAGEIIGEGLGFVARLVVEVVFEVLIKGTGHLVLKTVRPRHEPSDLATALVGIVILAAVIALAVFLYQADR